MATDAKKEKPQVQSSMVVNSTIDKLMDDKAKTEEEEEEEEIKVDVTPAGQELRNKVSNTADLPTPYITVTK